VLGVGGWVQRNFSRAVQPLTRHQCSIHCESSRLAHGASKPRSLMLTTRDIPRSVKSEYNKTELIGCGYVDVSFDEDIRN